MIGEWLRGKATMLGAASGAVAGLVAITPACGVVGPVGAIVLGIVAGLVCLWAVTGLKKMLGSDDSLDVFGVHCVGGIVGALLTGVFASKASVARRPDAGHLLDGRAGLDPDQGVPLTMVWSGVVAFIAYKIVDLTIGLRVTEEEEREGLDITSHGETAYNR